MYIVKQVPRKGTLRRTLKKAIFGSRVHCINCGSRYIKMIKQEEISSVEYLINSRPRKRLGGYTPYEVFYQETGVALDS